MVMWLGGWKGAVKGGWTYGGFSLKRGVLLLNLKMVVCTVGLR